MAWTLHGLFFVVLLVVPTSSALNLSNTNISEADMLRAVLGKLDNLENVITAHQQQPIQNRESELETEIIDLKMQLALESNGSAMVRHDAVADGQQILEHVVTMPLVTLMAGILASLFVGRLLHHAEIKWLPESTIFVLFGAAMGFAVKLYAGHQNHADDDLQYWFSLIFTAALNLALLPPIIFESGWSLRLKDFLSQLRYILIFAVFGTLISTFVVAFGIFLTAEYHGISNFRIAFTYASLISAVDPVATLATYTSLKVEPLLNIMVFGESTINDAVAIALFKAGDTDDPNEPMYAEKIILKMLWLLTGSSGVGILTGGVIGQLMHLAGMLHSMEFAVAVINLTSWFTYTIAEGFCHSSGIIASLFSGATLGVVLRWHIDAEAEEKITFQLKQTASIADITIFLCVGMAAVMTLEKIEVKFSLYIALLCLLGRLFAVFPLGFIANCLKRNHGMKNGLPRDEWNEISMAKLFMMWCAGLRGGIAMALVLSMRLIHKDPESQKLRQATFFVIASFLVIFGGTTPCLLSKLGIECGGDFAEDALFKVDFDTARSRSKSISRATLAMACNYIDRKPTMAGGSDMPRRSLSCPPGARLSGRPEQYDDSDDELFKTLTALAPASHVKFQDEESSAISFTGLSQDSTFNPRGSASLTKRASARSARASRVSRVSHSSMRSRPSLQERLRQSDGLGVSLLPSASQLHPALSERAQLQALERKSQAQVTFKRTSGEVEMRSGVFPQHWA